QALAAVLRRDGDPARAGIERVLHELLDDGRRAFDDLARGDLVGQFGRQTPDLRHATPQGPRRGLKSTGAGGTRPASRRPARSSRSPATRTDAGPAPSRPAAAAC